MLFRPVHLLLALLLAGPVFAQPAAPPSTQPAEAAADAEPVVVKGEVTFVDPIRAADIKFSVRGVRHRIVYEVVDGSLVLNPDDKRGMPTLRYAIQMPAGSTNAGYRSLIEVYEDDMGHNLLEDNKNVRAFDGWISAGEFTRREAPMIVDVSLPTFPRSPRSIGRVAGQLTVTVPTEVRSFDLPIDKTGATAAVSDSVSMTITSAGVVEGNRFEARVKIRSAQPGTQSLRIVGLGDDYDPGDGKKRPREVGPMSMSWSDGVATVLFAPGSGGQIRKMRVTTTTKTLEVPLRFDVRSIPMM